MKPGLRLSTPEGSVRRPKSGVAALPIAQKPALTPHEIRAILVRTAKHLGSRGSWTGHDCCIAVMRTFCGGRKERIKGLVVVLSSCSGRPNSWRLPEET